MQQKEVMKDQSAPSDVMDAMQPDRAPILDSSDPFVPRHIGPRQADIQSMLDVLGVASLDALIDETIPAAIRMQGELKIDAPKGEHETLTRLRTLAEKNQVLRSCIGMGYYGALTPAVIQRNVLENPGWYTSYTPYQAEISQGRLEAMLNFQTLVADLTGLPLANASLLDEATAAAEAMTMCWTITGSGRKGRNAFFVEEDCHSQTRAVVETRGKALGLEVVCGPESALRDVLDDVCGALFQYPGGHGAIRDYRKSIEALHDAGALAVVATDLLALTLLTPPGEFGADIALGSAQRFGCPMGFGGPHAAFLATHEAHARKMPGRLVGVSKDSAGHPAYRLTLQTREQHIRRDKATSNICTAQVLPAILSSMYAVYHGPDGLRKIARRTMATTRALAHALRDMGFDLGDAPFFDTLRVPVGKGKSTAVLREAVSRRINLRRIDADTIGISFDETTTRDDVTAILESIATATGRKLPRKSVDAWLHNDPLSLPKPFDRSTPFLTHPVFNQYHSETEMLRYMARLQERDVSLSVSMIPLGSCTMKLNGTSEMMPITWTEWANLHPFAPEDQTVGYHELFEQLEDWLADITGLHKVSLQPNAGSQGEYSGLMVIRAWHEHRGDAQRNVCLIPVSAHGTNPASAVIAGYRVVVVACDKNGNVDLDDLRAKAREHADTLGALMITYPSTHGVFETKIQEICDIVHQAGGQVYMDGANMNAQVGLCRPGDVGTDVCHLNLHKTFCIPHGGGGPGMGPIAVAEHLADFLPGHPVVAPRTVGKHAVGAVSAAPYGSPSILPISWMYLALMGPQGLERASQVAILNANYMVHRLEEHYSILYRGKNGRVAHEFILDMRPFAKIADIQIDDVAKRLMDFGFHAPTMSWPVPGTLMVEPTESESKQELDRFCDAMLTIYDEIQAIARGDMDRHDNPLKNAPHTAAVVTQDEWTHPYTRQQASYPAPWLKHAKFWPPVGRIDNYHGDRNLFCTCPPMEAFEE
jgi:glycine dehydrogenase